MVVDYHARRAPIAPAAADRVFHALADPTRRDIVQVTMREPHSVSALSRRYPMSFAAVQKHVAVLERAGLVTKERRGREQLVRGRRDTLRRAARILDDLEAVWRARVAGIDEVLGETTPAGSTTAPAVAGSSDAPGAPAAAGSGDPPTARPLPGGDPTS